jgi:hypothetical protein
LLAGTRDSLQFRVVDNSSLGSRIRHLMVDRQRRIWALGLSTGGTTMRLGCYRLTLATGIDGPLFALEKQVWNLTTLAGIEQAAFATPPSSIAHPWNAEPRISLQIKAVNRPWTPPMDPGVTPRIGVLLDPATAGNNDSPLTTTVAPTDKLR